MITSVLMAIGMAISILVEALLPSSRSAAAQSAAAGNGGGDGKPNNAKEWLMGKLKVLELLPGEVCLKWQKHYRASLGNHQLDPQYGEKSCGFYIATPMGLGRRDWRVALYIHGHEKVMS